MVAKILKAIKEDKSETTAETLLTTVAAIFVFLEVTFFLWIL